MNLGKYLNENYSKTSIKGYKNSINRFREVLGERSDTASYTDILDYIGILREQKLHPKSVRNHLFAVKIYFNYLQETGKRKGHPCSELYLKDKINCQIQAENLYPKEILQALYETYQAKNQSNQERDKIIISLLIYQALTVLEISQIKTGDIDLENGTIRITGNTKNKGRTLSLKPNQILLLHHYLKSDRKKYLRKPTDYFLLNGQGLPLRPDGINRLINGGKGRHEKLLPLKIRQSVIAHLLKENRDLRIVQEFAGHRRTSSTEAYRQTGLEELKSAIERLHPLQ